MKKKSIETNYAQKIIDSSKYSIVTISNKDADELPIVPNIKNITQWNTGIIYAPFIPMLCTEAMPSKKYTSFMKKYYTQHKCCPKCGSEKYTTTLAGYIFNPDKPDDYKDLNDCVCKDCKDFHTAHERVPKKKKNNI